MKTISFEEIRLITTCGAIVLTISTFLFPVRKESVLRLILKIFRKEFPKFRKISARKFYRNKKNIPTQEKNTSKSEKFFALCDPFDMESFRVSFEQALKDVGYIIFFNFPHPNSYIVRFGEEDSDFQFKIYMSRGTHVENSIRIVIEKI